jgi:RNA polymerase sigma-70 factor (ECF subfamily)
VGLTVTAARDQDLAIARRAADGDRSAQRELFMAQRRAVHHTLYRILGSNRDIEDLVQDAFIEIFRALPTFRGDSSLGRWCQTITTRIAYLAISRRKPATLELSLVEDIVPDASPDAARVAHAREAARRLYVALDQLDSHKRIAFALAVIDGLSLRDVAELTGTTTFAVKTRVWRGRRELYKRAQNDPVLRDYLGALDGGNR